MAKAASKVCPSFSGLCDQIFHNLMQAKGPDTSFNEFFKFAQEHYQPRLTDCYDQALATALSAEYTRLTNKRRKGLAQSGEAPISLFGAELPVCLTRGPKEKGGEFRHVAIEHCTIGDDTDEHLRLTEKQIGDLQAKYDSLKAAQEDALHLAKGDRSMTWGQIFALAP